MPIFAREDDVSLGTFVAVNVGIIRALKNPLALLLALIDIAVELRHRLVGFLILWIRLEQLLVFFDRFLCLRDSLRRIHVTLILTMNNPRNKQWCCLVGRIKFERPTRVLFGLFEMRFAVGP